MIRRKKSHSPTLPLLLLASLSACGSGSNDGAGGVSVSEASALNDAAAMLDARAGASQPVQGGLNPAAIAAVRADRNRRPADNGAEAP